MPTQTHYCTVHGSEVVEGCAECAVQLAHPDRDAEVDLAAQEGALRAAHEEAKGDEKKAIEQQLRKLGVKP